jgi:nitrite reductase (NADH) small subunit
MSQYVAVAKIGQISSGTGKTVVCAGRPIALFCVDGRYYAVDDYCPHMGASLGTGAVQDGAVVCDRHFWKFDLQSGVCLDAPTLKAKTFPVRVVGDDIEVALPDEAKP